jgi:hypothetical protein
VKKIVGLLVVFACHNALAGIADGTGISTQQNVAQTGQVVVVPKAWSVTVGLDHSVSAGTFTKDPYVREFNDEVVQSWMFSGKYKFKLGDHTLAAGLAAGFDVLLTVPNTNPARRISPQAVGLSLGDANMYTEKVTGITFFGNARMFLPTTFEDQSTKRILSVRGTAGMTRAFGPVELVYTLGVTKGFYSSNVVVSRKDIVRSTDNINARLANGVYEVADGRGVTQFDVRNMVGASWSILPQLSLSYYLTLINGFRQGIVSSEDAFTSVNADAGMGRFDRLQPSLTLAYQLPEVGGVNMSLSTGISASHPVQSNDNKSIILPFFYQTFAQNRAANNYGAVSMTLMATF